VSPLLFRHTSFEGNPVMLAATMLHERKLQQHHEIFFNIISKHVKHQKQVPIATDDETALINAIENETKFTRVGCHRHLRGDIKRWLDNHGGTKEDRKIYTDEVVELMQCKTLTRFEELLEEKEQKWSEAFHTYFHTKIMPKVNDYGKWSVSEMITLNGPLTTNQSEGFNTLLKSLQGWKEVPLDVVLLSLHMMQKYYLQEAKRGKAGLGNFVLKEEAVDQSIPPDSLCNQIGCPPESIVDSIRQGEYLLPEPSAVPVYSNVKYTQAREIIQNDQVLYRAKLGIFTVVSADKQKQSLFSQTNVLVLPDIHVSIHWQ
jgi:hypothetical protein